MGVRKAVLPVAGFGTRMLPATKSVAKEMITLIDKPLIHYAVLEAVESGIEQIIFVTSAGKSEIENYFDKSPNLELALENSGKKELLEEVRNISSMCEFVSVRQKEQKGLGHAVYCARDVVGDEPFAVILPDDIMRYKTPVTKQLIDNFEETHAPVVALCKVEKKDAHKYGIIEIDKKVKDNFYKLKTMVEKPKTNPPSDMAIIGRYILTKEILDEIGNTKSGALGEIQLTDAINAVASKNSVYGYEYEGRRFDCGNKSGYLEAVVNFALEREDISEDFKQILEAAGFKVNDGRL
ncbi:UTP-glucose-1-phosphate uridylyltransferase [Flexistipes sinusarabici DSM 4947]|uniref:UTP--glucose-1-phosphate uridylyltransferase n=2 Tax=Flexistipes sinusarabici TaxID=2352 RepID=F8E4A0_FLESM|nr:UTP--glucose-1-phosphate uridylyltransferase GalU [Flexistipes sinusarabici]AEI15527.1 UTP-glucose-1-phosphate uridylyltransferase [Flexistipes sinusarabici DSM 4947]HCW93983.1 UTP--glucose-1-phosphate uridylyltransferase [Flexistipes sinusarabici]